jgi:hypothetical protein
MGISRRLDELTDLACTSRGEVAGRGLRRRSKGGRSPRSGNGSRRCDVTWRRRGASSRRSRPKRRDRVPKPSRARRAPASRDHMDFAFPAARVSHSRPRLTVHLHEYMSFKQCGGAASGTHKMDKEGFGWIILLVALLVTGLLVISWPFWRAGEMISRYLHFRWKSATARSRT